VSRLLEVRGVDEKLRKAVLEDESEDAMALRFEIFRMSSRPTPTRHSATAECRVGVRLGL